MKASTKNRAKGTAKEAKGKAKEVAGHAMRNRRLAREGASDSLRGRARRKIGEAEEDKESRISPKWLPLGRSICRGFEVLQASARTWSAALLWRFERRAPEDRRTLGFRSFPKLARMFFLVWRFDSCCKAAPVVYETN